MMRNRQRAATAIDVEPVEPPGTATGMRIITHLGSRPFPEAQKKCRRARTVASLFVTVLRERPMFFGSRVPHVYQHQ